MTTDVTLTADLYCPSGDGIILGSNVTLDLGGHSLVGDGSGVGVQTDFSPKAATPSATARNRELGNRDPLREERGQRRSYIVSDVVLLNSPVSHYVGITTLHLTRVTAVDSMIVGQFSSDLAISQSTLTRSDVRVFFATTATITGFDHSPEHRQRLPEPSSHRHLAADGKGISALGSVSEGIISISNSVVKNYAEPISGSWGGARLTNNTFTDMPNGVLGDVSSNLGFDGPSHIVGNTFTRSGVALRGNVPMIVENNTFTHNEIGVEFTRIEPFADVRRSPLTARAPSATS